MWSVRVAYRVLYVGFLVVILKANCKVVNILPWRNPMYLLVLIVVSFPVRAEGLGTRLC